MNANSTLVTGGTGFVGRKLLPYLDQATVLSRNQQSAHRRLDDLGCPIDVVEWDPKSGPVKLPASRQYRQVVNLMGESIAEGRWNKDKKQRIRDSRILGTRNLVEGLLQHGNLPDVFVSASAIGFYGDPGEVEVDEQHPAGKGFLPDVCREWEAEASVLEQHGVRVIFLRIGLVIGAEGGAFKEMAPIFRWGVGGNLGNGQQWMAWIHVDDLVQLILHCLQSDSLRGPVNATAPNPVRNSTFTKAMGKVLRRPTVLPAPKFALRLVLGEFADSLFFSQRILPAAALESGFKFQFDQIDAALADVA